MATTTLLFVYGTLMRGASRHDLLAAARFAGDSQTAPGFDLVDLGDHPGLVAGGRHRVAGELYRVVPAVLAGLDAYEGHPGTFRRSPIAVAGDRPAEAYLVSGAVARGRRRLPAVDGVVRWSPPAAD